MRIRNAQIMAESNFREELFPAEITGNMAEIAVFADFHEDFHWTFPYILFVVFLHKNNNDITFSSFLSSLLQLFRV